MKTLILYLSCCLMIPLNANSSAIDYYYEQLPERSLNKEQFKNKEPTKQPAKKLNKYRFIQSVSNNLIAHSKFLFLENVEIEDWEIEKYESVLEDYATESALMTPYSIKGTEAYSRYKQLIGKTLKVNNYNRVSFEAPIIDIVLVNDKMVRKPYVAAVLEVPEGMNIYYAWTSLADQLSYPFERVEVGTESLLRKKFENTAAYAHFEEEYETNNEGDLEFKIQAFEHFEGRKYYVLQASVTGSCSSLIDNLVAVYEVKDDKTTLIALNKVDYFIIDMIDMDNDDYPDLLGGDFSSSVFYTLKNGEIETVKLLTWSTEECPC